jgi:hypothetical protein
MTSPYHFYFVFLPRIASNCKKVRFGEVVVPKQIPVPRCFQQIGEIDNLTVSWDKVFWLCCVQVSRCWWRRSNHVPYCLLAPVSNNLQEWFSSPTGRLNLGFILRENLLLCSSDLPLGFSQLILWDIRAVDCFVFNSLEKNPRRVRRDYKGNLSSLACSRRTDKWHEIRTNESIDRWTKQTKETP